MSEHDNRLDLGRFRDAQDPLLARVTQELSRGRKTSHWMWFVFPQIAGLGHSAMSQRYAIASRDEARAFIADPVLGSRLRELTALVVALPQGDAEEVFGPVDAAKFRSCMTLFDAVAPQGVFAQALQHFFGGERDPETLRRIGKP